jgi:hypothetical protein
MALSWCSLSDPGRVVRDAERIGYTLNSLFCVAIGDGEYSGKVHDYLRSLRYAYISEDRQTVDVVAPDGSGRFAYLLMAGDFSIGNEAGVSSDVVEDLARRFSQDGIRALTDTGAGSPVKCWVLDRWDEVRLRAQLHGSVRGAGYTPA